MKTELDNYLDFYHWYLSIDFYLTTLFEYTKEHYCEKFLQIYCVRKYPKRYPEDSKTAFTLTWHQNLWKKCRKLFLRKEWQNKNFINSTFRQLLLTLSIIVFLFQNVPNISSETEWSTVKINTKQHQHISTKNGKFNSNQTGLVLLCSCLRQKKSQDRPKSAPYPRLKNSKKTSKCQVFFYITRKSKILRKTFFRKKLHTQKNWPSGAPGPAIGSPWRAERGTLPKLSTFLSQLKGTLWKKIRKKVSQCRKTERGDPLVFSNIHSVAKQQKIEGGPFGEKNSRKKSRSAEKNSPGMVCYAWKQEKPFLVQFGRPNSAIWCNNIL